MPLNGIAATLFFIPFLLLPDAFKPRQSNEAVAMQFQVSNRLII